MKRTYKAILLSFLLVVPFAGCDTEDLRDLNVNPNALTTINMNYLFSAAQLGAASGGSAGDNRYIDWRTNINYCSFFVQHMANTGAGGDKYFDIVESYNAPWEFIYGDQLKNLAEVLKQTGPGGFEEGRRKNTREAARIMRVLLFHRLTDYYGNIPYSEANKGITGTFYPKYDDQATIYADLLKELSEAAAAINTLNPDDGFASADMMFQGDVARWKRFANSLMLRLAMRASMADAAMAATYVTQAVAGGTMAANTDNAWIPMSETPSLWTNQNGISRAYIPGDGGANLTMSKTLIDELKGPNAASILDDDPRLAILTEGGAASPLGQHGMPNGLDAGTLIAYQAANPTITAFSQINIKLLDRAEPYMIMAAAESEFLKAEAVVRGIGTVGGTAQSHYDAGVRLAQQMLVNYDASFAVSNATVDAYLLARPYPVAGSQAVQLNAIGTQLWVSKFFNWWDSWADIRRSGYPALVPVNYPGNTSNGQIPSKLRLPTHEVATNFPNIDAGATKPDDPTGKVWWDK